jgi:hypothetical protein
MIERLRCYVLGSYPPAFYLPYAAAWALGGMALFALGQRDAPAWRPGWGALVTVATFVIVLLLVRGIDDLRDLEYDREYNPRRPLPSGAVGVADLAVLIPVCALVALGLNSARGAIALALAAPLAYAAVLLITERNLRWPPGHAMVLSSLISFPVQILLDLYLYAALLHDTGRAAGPGMIVPLLVVLTVFIHLELARKITRTPRPGERSYVIAFGVDATAVAALTAVGISTVLGLLLVEPWRHAAGAGWGWLVLAPLALPAHGAWSFWRRRSNRWPVLDAALYLIATFVVYLIIDLVERRTS